LAGEPLKAKEGKGLLKMEMGDMGKKELGHLCIISRSVSCGLVRSGQWSQPGWEQSESTLKCPGAALPWD